MEWLEKTFFLKALPFHNICSGNGTAFLDNGQEIGRGQHGTERVWVPIWKYWLNYASSPSVLQANICIPERESDRAGSEYMSGNLRFTRQVIVVDAFVRLCNVAARSFHGLVRVDRLRRHS